MVSGGGKVILWVKIVAPLVALVVAFGAGYKVATWKWSGRVEKAVAAQEAAEKDRDKAEALEAQWRQDIKDVNQRLADLQVARDTLQAAYDEAVSRPPEVVIRYRDRIREIPQVIVSEDCTNGLGELFTFLDTLPERAP